MSNIELPNADKCLVTDHKVLNYLLSITHPEGRGKAVFFARAGYTTDNWRDFVFALKSHARNNPVALTVQSDYGVKYIVDGTLQSPTGVNPQVKTIWIVKSDDLELIPRLVTAYPILERQL